MRNTISNMDDVIDSRDVIARIEELEEEREGLVADLDDAKNRNPDDPEAGAIINIESDLETWDADKGDELKALKALADEGEGSPDWAHGETLIRDSYWTEYVQQLLEDIGELPKDLPHYIEIDWERTARNIQVDYFSVDFDGVEYWIRS